MPTTPASLARLRALASADPDAAETLAALEATIAGQAAITRALTIELRNRRIAQAELERTISAAALAPAATLAGSPARTTFSAAEADRAAADLAAAATTGADAARLLTTLARLVSIFV